MEINLTQVELEILRELIEGGLESLWRSGEEESETYRLYSRLRQKLTVH